MKREVRSGQDPVSERFKEGIGRKLLAAKSAFNAQRNALETAQSDLSCLKEPVIRKQEAAA